MSFSNTEDDEKNRERAFFCLKKYKVLGVDMLFILPKATLLLNFHQIFSRNNLSVEMSSGSLYPYFICQ
jgi:hypothetical protein